MDARLPDHTEIPYLCKEQIGSDFKEVCAQRTPWCSFKDSLEGLHESKPREDLIFSKYIIKKRESNGDDDSKDSSASESKSDSSTIECPELEERELARIHDKQDFQSIGDYQLVLGGFTLNEELRDLIVKIPKETYFQFLKRMNEWRYFLDYAQTFEPEPFPLSSSLQDDTMDELCLVSHKFRNSTTYPTWDQICGKDSDGISFSEVLIIKPELKKMRSKSEETLENFSSMWEREECMFSLCYLKSDMEISDLPSLRRRIKKRFLTVTRFIKNGLKVKPCCNSKSKIINFPFRNHPFLRKTFRKKCQIKACPDSSCFEQMEAPISGNQATVRRPEKAIREALLDIQEILWKAIGDGEPGAVALVRLAAEFKELAYLEFPSLAALGIGYFTRIVATMRLLLTSTLPQSALEPLRHATFLAELAREFYATCFLL